MTVTIGRERFRRTGLFPETLLVIGAPAHAQHDMTFYCTDIARCEFALSADAAHARLRNRTHIAVVMAVPSAGQAACIDDYLNLRRQFSQTAFLALFVSGDSDLTSLARLASGGISHVLVQQRLHLQEHVLSTLASSTTHQTAGRVWAQASIEADNEVVTLMLAALRLAHRPISLPQLAQATQMHERTLRKYCDRHRLPSPQWIIGWARCLLAAYYLEESGRPVQAVAEVLHFNSAVLLANHLRRYTGLTATELRRCGALAIAARRLEEFLRAETSPLACARGWRPSADGLTHQNNGR